MCYLKKRPCFSATDSWSRKKCASLLFLNVKSKKAALSLFSLAIRCVVVA